uniref:50S ribosomal protein L5, chloroplastic n=1 Tax=Nitzschia sp. IriIs04 TaxID=1444690 RepID=A0A0S3QPP0_9STRA|nr:ribosomal protein L5 [Nitzschia sp. IriIs04]BAT70300.1 ribosomal protein L5 [Nitzschia sp. IriIs04]
MKINKNHILEEIVEIYNLLIDLKSEYFYGIKPILIKKYNKQFPNLHLIPKIEKIILTRGIGLSSKNKELLNNHIFEFETITGQKPIITKAKRSISGFKIHKNLEIGLSVTLRNKKMYAFLTKLLFFTFPQIKDFKGLSIRNFDKAGNYHFGINNQFIFPEINYNHESQDLGFTISIILNQSNKKKTIKKQINNLILFKFLRFPFYDYGYYNKYESFLDIKDIWKKKRILKRKRWSN